MWVISLLFSILLISGCTDTSAFQIVRGNECDDYQIACQNFEGTGYDHGETWAELGSTLPDEDSTATVLRGSQSCLLTDTGTDAKITNTLPASYPALWVFFRSRWAAITTGGRCVYLLDSGTVAVGSLYMDAGPTWRLEHPMSGVHCHGTTVLQVNTTYYNWVYWNDDSGPDDGSMTMYVGTSPNRSLATQECSIVAGTGENDVVDIRFEQGGDGSWIVDQILVDTDEIVNVMN